MTIEEKRKYMCLASMPMLITMLPDIGAQRAINNILNGDAPTICEAWNNFYSKCYEFNERHNKHPK